MLSLKVHLNMLLKLANIQSVLLAKGVFVIVMDITAVMPVTMTKVDLINIRLRICVPLVYKSSVFFKSNY